MSKEYIVVFCTCPDETSAETLAELVVEKVLAACVNIIPAIHSVFYWQGKIEKTQEVLLIIKTMRTYYSELEIMIRTHHPYETPEIISCPIQQGFEGYLDFIQQSLERTLP